MTAQEKNGSATPPDFFVYKPDNITSQGNPLIKHQHEGKRYELKSKTTNLGLGCELINGIPGGRQA